MSNVKFTQLPNLGNITGATIVPVVDSGINYTVTGANLQTYITSTTGNITGNYFIGNGSQLTGVVTSSYGNSNVANYLPTFSGDLTAGNVSVAGNITGSYLFGNGSQLTGIITNYSNANVAAYLPTFSGNLTAGNIAVTTRLTADSVSAAGDVIAGFFIGNGAQIGNITAANIVGTVANATYAVDSGTATTATTANTVTENAQANITSVGTLTTLSVSGNTTVDTMATGNISITGIVSATGNITGNYFIGNGSQLTGIIANTTYDNSNVAAFLPTYTGNLVALTGNVTTSANVQGAYIKGNGLSMTGLVTSIVAGSGISVSQATGAVTVTNTSQSANAVIKLASSFVQGSLTANSSMNISNGVLIPAGTVAAGDVLEIVVEWLNGPTGGSQRQVAIFVNTANSIPVNGVSSNLCVFSTFLDASVNKPSRTSTPLDVILTTNGTRGVYTPGAAGTITYPTATGYGIAAGSYYSYQINWSVNQYIVFGLGNLGYCNGYQIYKK